MNETIVILGNGFDLDLGWKTSYNDFYNAKKSIFTNLHQNQFVREMIKEGYWNDLEGYLRKCISNINYESIEDINYFWILCRNNIGSYLLQNKNIYTTNENSCAYTLLSKITSLNVLSFNYTNPFKIIGCNNKILNIHGSLDNFKSGAEILLGVDYGVRDINNLITREDSLKYIVKTNENENIDGFHLRLREARNIIIYGHSLGITDSDYFKPLFEAIINNKIVNKKIYIVTYDEASLQSIKDNMMSYNVDYSRLLYSNVSIKTVFTSRGKDCDEFCSMIRECNL